MLKKRRYAMRRPHTGRRLSISGRKYYRHVHRGQAIDLFRVIANRLSLSLSPEGIVKRNRRKKRGNRTAVRVDTCPTEMQHCPATESCAGVEAMEINERRWGARPEATLYFRLPTPIVP